MILVALFFFCSFAYSVIMIIRRGQQKERRLFVFPLIDLSFSLVLVALMLFGLTDTWLEYVLMALFLVYIIYRSRTIKARLMAESKKQKKKDDEEKE